MKKWIVERDMLFEPVNGGERRQFTIRIGIPYWIEGEEFATCPREYDGFLDEVADTKGVDVIHALFLASDVDRFLTAFRSKYNFYYLSGEDYFEE